MTKYQSLVRPRFIFMSYFSNMTFSWKFLPRNFRQSDHGFARTFVPPAFSGTVWPQSRRKQIDARQIRQSRKILDQSQHAQPRQKLHQVRHWIWLLLFAGEWWLRWFNPLDTRNSSTATWLCCKATKYESNEPIPSFLGGQEPLLGSNWSLLRKSAKQLNFSLLSLILYLIWLNHHEPEKRKMIHLVAV